MVDESPATLRGDRAIDGSAATTACSSDEPGRADYARTSFLYATRCGWSASGPFRRFRSSIGGSNLSNGRAVLWKDGAITRVDALIPAELNVRTCCGGWGGGAAGLGVGIENGGHIVVPVRRTTDGARLFALLAPKP